METNTNHVPSHKIKQLPDMPASLSTKNHLFKIGRCLSHGWLCAPQTKTTIRHGSGSEIRLLQDDRNCMRKRGCSESVYKSLTSSRVSPFLQHTSSRVFYQKVLTTWPMSSLARAFPKQMLKLYMSLSERWRLLSKTTVQTPMFQNDHEDKR